MQEFAHFDVTVGSVPLRVCTSRVFRASCREESVYRFDDIHDALMDKFMVARKDVETGAEARVRLAKPGEVVSILNLVVTV